MKPSIYVATRQLDDLDRLVLPPLARALLGVAPGDAVDILVDADGVRLRPVARRTLRKRDRPGDSECGASGRPKPGA